MKKWSAYFAGKIQKNVHVVGVIPSGRSLKRISWKLRKGRLLGEKGGLFYCGSEIRSRV